MDRGLALAELGHRIGTHVALFDALGDTLESHPSGWPGHTIAALRKPIDQILSDGSWRMDTIAVDGHTFTVHTLGRGDRLRGVLAIEGEVRDQETRAVLTTMVAMSGFVLEQNAGLQGPT